MNKIKISTYQKKFFWQHFVWFYLIRIEFLEEKINAPGAKTVKNDVF